jgi:Ca-activated chloride channel family protein
MKKTTFLLASLCLTTFAQRIIPPPPRPIPLPPPVIKLPPEVKASPIEISDVDIVAKINGIHCETTMEMTFYNPNNRVLEGELVFPLPTDATVAGYALDINGKMIDGVIVDKQKARVVFEEITRAGIDPGLVEHSAGNLFKTRIYPLMARASRRIRVTYVSTIAVQDNISTYVQPLRFNNALKTFSLRIEVAAAQKVPEVKSGPLNNFNFTTWNSIYLAETKLQDIKLSEDLYVAIPTVPHGRIAVENNDDDMATFAIDVDDVNDLLKNAAAKPDPVKTILWDASDSRGKSEHDKEIELIKKFIPKDSPCTLIVFRHKAMPPKDFDNVDKLVKEIENLYYDGASNLADAISQIKPESQNVLLFSDGLANFGPSIDSLELKKYRISAAFQDRDQDAATLRKITRAAGGKLLDLRKTSVEQAYNELQLPAIDVQEVLLNGKNITSQCQVKIENGTLALAGMINKGKHTINLKIACLNATKSFEFTFDTADAPQAKLLKTHYGQLLIANLLADNAPEATVAETGRKFGLVTPSTSLMVLDSLQQYIQYRIRPPETLPEWRAQYDRAEQDFKKQPEPGTLQPNDPKYVLEIWNNLVQWHKKKDFASQGVKKAVQPAPTRARQRLNAPAILGAVMADGAAVADGAVAMEAAPARARAMEKSEISADTATATVAIKPWSSEAPYLKDLEKNRKDPFPTYLKLKETYGEQSGFYMDCSDFFANQLNDKNTAIAILSNLAEIQYDNKQLLRILGYKLRFLDDLENAEIAFRAVLKIAPEEPQTYRDLAAILDQQEKFQEAADALLIVVNNKFDRRFQEIENIALTELNRIVARAKRKNITITGLKDELTHLIDTDIRVVINWDTDMTDMDLWVTDPFGERCFYGHRFTSTGGRNSPDFTQGYGPEDFMIRNAKKGTYLVQTDYYGSRSQKVIGPVTLYAEVFTNYGRPDETRQTLAFRLGGAKEVVEVAKINHTGINKPYTYPQPFQYQVKKGDTWESISTDHYGDNAYVQAIKELNPAQKDKDKPAVGTILTLPATK